MVQVQGQLFDLKELLEVRPAFPLVVVLLLENDALLNFLEVQVLLLFVFILIVFLFTLLQVEGNFLLRTSFLRSLLVGLWLFLRLIPLSFLLDDVVDDRGVEVFGKRTVSGSLPGEDVREENQLFGGFVDQILKESEVELHLFEVTGVEVVKKLVAKKRFFVNENVFLGLSFALVL